jgi:hypothetical protein
MSSRLPNETLHEIVLYLPRHVLKSLLLFQPHPVGQIASDLYFSKLSLHFGARDKYKEMDALAKWHDERSRDILLTIVEKSSFAKKVQTLKIYSPGSKDTDALTFQIGTLQYVLWCLVRSFHWQVSSTLPFLR